MADIRHQACDTSYCDITSRQSEKKAKADRKHRERQTNRQTEGNSLAGEFRYSDRQYRCIDYLQHFESLVIRNRWNVTGNVQNRHCSRSTAVDTTACILKMETKTSPETSVHFYNLMCCCHNRPVYDVTGRFEPIRLA